MFQDIDCGGSLDGWLNASLNDGSLPESAVDTALTHLFSVQFRLGMYDPAANQPYTQLTTSAINTPDHQQLALDAARQGMVLLKNDGNTLPLSAGTIKTIAAIGPNGEATRAPVWSVHFSICFRSLPQQTPRLQ